MLGPSHRSPPILLLQDRPHRKRYRTPRQRISRYPVEDYEFDESYYNVHDPPLGQIPRTLGLGSQWLRIARIDIDHWHLRSTAEVPILGRTLQRTRACRAHSATQSGLCFLSQMRLRALPMGKNQQIMHGTSVFTAYQTIDGDKSWMHFITVRTFHLTQDQLSMVGYHDI